MKRKLLILIIIMTFVAPLFLGIYKVHNISYQKVDITKEKLDTIGAKFNKVNDYKKTSNQTLKEKESNLDILQQTYQELQQDANATEEQIATAKTNYETAYAEYTEYYNNIQTQVKKLQDEYLASIPNYTNSWKTATNTSNNVKLDFSNYAGTVHFILWVKIDNGINTYYDFNSYTSEIETETKTDPEQPGTDDSDTTTEGDWTDFSNAKLELKKDGISGAIVEVSGVTPKKNSSYYLLITSNSSKPTANEEVYKEGIELVYDETSKKLKSSEMDKISNYVELNQDLYANVVETQMGLKNNAVVSYGNKLTRFNEPKYSDAFFATYMVQDSDQIVVNFTHNRSNNRKIQIKIGKVTDVSILKKIKNKSSTGFEELLKFTKSNSGIYNQTVDADKDDSFAIEYNAGTKTDTPGISKGNSVINLNGLEDDEYYFLYVKTDDENGKYVSNEAVTLAQANVYNGGWGLFFYGSSDFKWSEWDLTEKDDTVAPGILPQTGIGYVVCGMGILIVILSSFIAYKKYKKYNF